MPTIVTANNLTIHTEGNKWRLFNGTEGSALPLIEAAPNGLAYQSVFGNARRLPADGWISSDLITMVVVGWAVEDTNWHLGIMVTPELARTRGGRWCGVARWRQEEGQSAADAGQLLAAALGKPFRLVPPADNAAPISGTQPGYDQPTVPMSAHPASPAYPAAPVAPPPTLPEAPYMPPPLMPLPISVGEWTMTEVDNGLQWSRAKGWRNKTLLNMGFFGVLAGVFGALSIGAVLSPFAAPQPEWLPLVGLALFVLMLILMLGQWFSLLRSTTVLIDNHQKLLRVMRGYNPKTGKARRTLIQSPYEGIEYVLVSHILTRQERNAIAEDEYTTYDRIWPEVWIHAYSPRRGFISVCYISNTEGRMMSGLDFTERQSLMLEEIDTPVHHAAMHMAEMMDVPIYAEKR